jgi:hypothetical protein
MTDPAPRGPGTPRPSDPAGPSITATASYVVIGAGFLPDHDVTVRVIYTAEETSDYLTYTTDHGGFLYAVIPTSAAPGLLHITATDHRTDRDGACGLLWSNTETVHCPPPREG